MSGVALGPDTDVTHSELCLGGDEVCAVASQCSICGDVIVCPEHSDDFTTCVDDPDALHCGDCRLRCPDCEAAYAQDHAEGLL